MISKEGATVLVVDGQREHADGLAEALGKVCGRVVAVYSGQQATEFLRHRPVDVVVTGLKLDGQYSGFDILDVAKKVDEKIEVILITAYATIETCKEAIRRGAYDYLVKPIDVEQLRRMVVRAGQRAGLRSWASGNQQQESRWDGSVSSQQIAGSAVRQVPQAGTLVKVRRREFEFEGIRGRNQLMQQILDVLRRVSPTNITVLIEGESGTGKELLAKAIHNNSPRRNRAFVPINCAGLSETLLESELFGHVKGAFTGAAADRKGLLEAADKGTLFLDEIGDMPLTMQAKLLRVLEDGLVTLVGSTRPIVVDVRLISATNHDLTKLIEEKKFRQDLYFRIKGVSITVPPLRNRAQDIPGLAQFFLQEAVAEVGSPVRGISEAAQGILMAYDWPGNIRQLRNCIRTMVVMCDREKLDVQDIPPEIRPVRQLVASTIDLSGLSLSDLERRAIIDTLAKVGGNREKAAKILGIGERTLYRKIKEYNL
jgi:two-component system response regulator HydG